MEARFCQRSINIPMPLTSSRPLTKSSTMICSCLNLNAMRLNASRLEDRIVYTLLERTTYSYDRSLYNIHASLDYENEGGLLRRVVSKIEHLQAAFGSFKVPEEVPFFPNNLPEEWFDLDAAVGSPPLVLDHFAASLNVNSKIWTLYNIFILNSMGLKEENDGRQGSALSCDASCIQAISRRVHWGKFLAEAKFQMSPSKFKKAVKAKDKELLKNALNCEEHREAAATRYIDIANVTKDKQLAIAANVLLGLVLPLAEEMEQLYVEAKLVHVGLT